MGLLVNPGTLFSNLPLLGVMIVLIVPGKFLVWTFVVRVFGHSMWTAIPVAVGLTQIGEFSFVLVQVARSAGAGWRRGLQCDAGRIADYDTAERGAASLRAGLPRSRSSRQVHMPAASVW